MTHYNRTHARLSPGTALRTTIIAALSALSPIAVAAIGVHDPAIQPTAPAHPAIPAVPRGTTLVLTFEGLGNQEAVNEFYNGGTGGNGSGPGPDYGITFTSNSLSIIDADAGGTGNFGGEPSPDTVLFFLTGAAATMNVPGGFTTGFSFYYSAINNPGQIRVYDGLDASGNLLATLDLPLTPYGGAPDPSGDFSPLVPIGVSFTGTARSVDFGGTVNQVAFDDITLGTDTPGGPGDPPPAPPEAIPTPLLSPGGLAALGGLLGLVALAWNRRTKRALK